MPELVWPRDFPVVDDEFGIFKEWPGLEIKFHFARRHSVEHYGTQLFVAAMRNGKGTIMSQYTIDDSVIRTMKDDERRAFLKEITRKMVSDLIVDIVDKELMRK